MTIADVSGINLVDPAIYAHGIPHDLFTELRAAGGVHRHRAEQILPGGPEVAFWSIVRHAEIQQANRDWETFTATHNVVIDPAPSERSGSMLVSTDPPAHTQAPPAHHRGVHAADDRPARSQHRRPVAANPRGRGREARLRLRA